MAAACIPSGVEKELAWLLAVVLEKSKSYDKTVEETRLSTSSTESKLADTANWIGGMENRLCFDKKLTLLLKLLKSKQKAERGNDDKPHQARFLRFQDRIHIAVGWVIHLGKSVALWFSQTTPNV